MFAVFKLNESGVRFILISEEDFSDLVAVTHSTLGRTRFSTNPDTRVSTWQDCGARLITARSVAGLRAQSSTLQVRTAPETRFTAWITRTSAGLRTVAVRTPVLTRSTARWTLVGTRLSALVSTDESSTAVSRARRV